MTKERPEEKVRKLRRSQRIRELETERVVDLCLTSGRIKTLLDIGTGSGVFAEAFGNSGLDVQGIDPDPEMISAARGLLPSLQFVVGCAERLPYASGSLDACFMGMVLHETRQPTAALAEACRVARKMVAVLEWPYPRPGVPLPKARRFNREQVEAMARNAGCRQMSAHTLQYMVLYLLPLV